jgi:hypothetical protein
MLRLVCPPSTQLYLRSTVDTALQIYRQLSAATCLFRGPILPGAPILIRMTTLPILPGTGPSAPLSQNIPITFQRHSNQLTASTHFSFGKQLLEGILDGTF